jgi:hypothetical protein
MCTIRLCMFKSVICTMGIILLIIPVKPSRHNPHLSEKTGSFFDSVFKKFNMILTRYAIHSGVYHPISLHNQYYRAISSYTG